MTLLDDKALREQTKRIEDYPNYSISTDGRVFSHKTKQFLKHSPGRGGYMAVRLVNSSGHRAWRVHRLVGRAFIPNLENKPYINHIDCNPSNNHVSNLEWCTPKENTAHMVKLGRWFVPPPNKASNYCYKGHQFEPDNVVTNSKGHRRCKICYTAYHQKYNKKRWADHLAKLQEG